LVRGEDEDGDVIVLHDSDFDEIVKSSDLILVEFYAPWCGHCKKLAPEYSIAATKLLKHQIKLAKLDATVETETASKFGISGYPTLKIFRKGNPTEYKGPRDAEGIVNYMIKQSGDSAKLINTVEEFNKFLEHQDVSIIGFFPSKSGSNYQNFLNTADQLREEFRFGLIHDSNLINQLKYGEGISLFKPWEDKKSVMYTGPDTTSALTDWLYSNSLPLVGEFNKETSPRYSKKGLPVLKAFFDVDFGSTGNLKRTNYYINRIKKAISDNSVHDKLLFSVAKKSSYKDEMEKFGLSYDDEISVAIDDSKNSLKYKFKKEFNVDNLKEFIDDFVAGKIKPYIKSSPVPENNNEPVKVVVGETFNDIVMDPSKDVLLEMYAPWCGHCKKLEPIYKELAESLSDVPTITIAKMDATSNDSPNGKYQAKGYPTILFAPANDKQNPISFSGERTVKGFTDFLKEKSHISWSKK